MKISAPRRSQREAVFIEPSASFRLKEIYAPKFPFLWHHHPEVELLLIVSGRGVRLVGDSIEDFDDGDLCLMGPNLPHSWFSRDERLGRQHVLVLQFRPEALNAGANPPPEYAKALALLSRSSSGLKFHGPIRAEASARMLELRNTQPGSLTRFARVLELLDLLTTPSGSTALSNAKTTFSDDKDHSKRIDEVFAYVDRQLRLGRSAHQGQISARLGMTPSAFSRFFKRATGRTFNSYVNALRVSAACHALIESNDGVATIAEAVGFANLSNFNRRFREIKHTSPQGYRRRVRGGSG